MNCIENWLYCHCWYKTGDAAQFPNDEYGLTSKTAAPTNLCPSTYCIPFCPTNLSEDKEDYLDVVDLYWNAYNGEEWDTASAYKLIMNGAAMRVIQHYLKDTLTFNNDSLMLWYHYLLNPVGEILRSKYFASKGDFVTAGQLLAAIPNFYNLSQHEEDDLDRIQEIYDILDARSVDNLTSGDLEDLEVIALLPGHSAAMAKGILGLYDYHFGPEYYLPEEEEEAQEFDQPSTVRPDIDAARPIVFPNPLNDRVLNVVLPKDMEQMWFELIDVNGMIIMSAALSNRTNELDLQDVRIGGVYQYRVSGLKAESVSGVLVIVQE